MTDGFEEEEENPVNSENETISDVEDSTEWEEWDEGMDMKKLIEETEDICRSGRKNKNPTKWEEIEREREGAVARERMEGMECCATGEGVR